jgi:hypothetical protein
MCRMTILIARYLQPTLDEYNARTPLGERLILRIPGRVPVTRLI